MAKDKEKSINPAQQQRKLDKAKALKKSKSELQARRNEKLARRNPDRIQRQIDDLKALESAGDIKPREKAILADLERDLKAVNKARESLGEKAPQYSNRPRESDRNRDHGDGVLGKRRHNGERKHQGPRHGSPSGSDTDESVRNIPWPRDTPPPVPQAFRRSNRNVETAPFGEGRSYAVGPKPVEVRTTYESAPQIRDLKKEAVNRFVPSVVKRKQDAVKGTGGQLLEPEEMDRLEREGYLKSSSGAPGVSEKDVSHSDSAAPPIDTDEVRRLKEEEERFERELAMQDAEAEEAEVDERSMDTTKSNEGRKLQFSRHVEIEEVDDEDL